MRLDWYSFALGLVTLPALLLLASVVLIGWLFLFDPIKFQDGESKSIED
jgi:hypothetical protein